MDIEAEDNLDKIKKRAIEAFAHGEGDPEVGYEVPVAVLVYGKGEPLYLPLEHDDLHLCPVAHDDGAPTDNVIPLFR